MFGRVKERKSFMTWVPDERADGGRRLGDVGRRGGVVDEAVFVVGQGARLAPAVIVGLVEPVHQW